MSDAAAFAATLVDGLAAAGVRHACIAPGSRSAPLAVALARHPDIHCWVHVDERSGSFFALGLARASGRPVLLLCTSGTAAAEFHPAVVEADMGRVPLIVVTADRPPELIGVGANQAIDQTGLYGRAVRWFAQPGVPEEGPGAATRWRRLAHRAVAEATGPSPGPVHLNLAFREPLVPLPGEMPVALPGPSTIVERPRPALDADQQQRVRSMVGSAQRALVVAGSMDDGVQVRAVMREFLAATGAVLVAEPTSQLRVSNLPGGSASIESCIRDAGWAETHRPDLVIRIGATPTSKQLNSWLADAGHTVLIDPGGGWRDPDLHAAEVWRCEVADWLAAAISPPLASGTADAVSVRGTSDWQATWSRDRATSAIASLSEPIAAADVHEGHVVRALAAALPVDADVMVGSSLAVRAVDYFWPPTPEGQRFFGNRGASGIDGLVSTGFGLAASGGRPVAMLLGDLSLFHDMNGLWCARRHGLHPVIVVVDNDGGGIFEFLPPARETDVFEEMFATPIGIRLEDVARLHDLDYVEATVPTLEASVRHAFAAGRATLVRVAISRAASVSGHAAAWEAGRRALPAPRGA